MYIKTIDRFLKDVEPDSLAELIRELEKNTSVHTGEAERQSWEESLPALARVLTRLPQAVQAGCEIVLEARYMVEEKRADAVLAGTWQGRPVLLFIENKRWSHLNAYRPDGENTLLAYLYQNAHRSGLRVRYVEKNRDPRKTLEHEMKVPRQAMISSLRNQTNHYDCLICDESHRMLERVWEEECDFLDRFLELSRVSVFFYDESQSVHISDYVTRERALDAAHRRGLGSEAIRERSLVYQHRCHEADRFLDAVDRLLDHPELGLDGLGPFNGADPYPVELVDDPRELFRLIREKNKCRGKNHSSRVLAGKGRSYGRDWEWAFNNSNYHEKKSIAPLRDSDEALYTWNFGNYGADVTFASDEDSIDLVGCIDTSQGLDFEYVGVIIAPDLIYDPQLGQIRVCVEGHQKSDPNTGRWNISDSPRVRQVILNAYRVLLSRGEKGCYIYCCDENLQRYLSRIIRSDPPEKEARMTGTIQHVAASGKYAYIDSEGISYPVNEATVRQMTDAKELLVKGKTVTFLVRQSSTGKRYAYDLRDGSN